MKTDLISRTLPSLPSTLNARFVGFDNLFDELFSSLSYDPVSGFRTSHSVDKFPPYNMEKIDDSQYVISVAVAGFKKEDLSVELNNGLLVISGNKTEKSNNSYIYQGIAERSFSRSFRLGEFIEVSAVSLEDGILAIHLTRHIPESMKPRKFDIL